MYPGSELMSAATKEKKSKNVVSPFKYDSWIKKGYSDEEAKRKVEEYQLDSKEKNMYRSPRKLQHWIDKGYSESDAKIMLSRFQDNKSLSKLESKYGSIDVALKKYKGNINNIKPAAIKSKYSVRSKMYWIDQGYSESDAKCLAGNLQRRDLAYFIEKHGEYEGTKKYKDWTSQTINSCGGISKESVDFFTELKSKISDFHKGNIIFGKNEFKIEHNNGKYFKYDFTIVDLNVIVEYHGIAWHPKSRIDESWVHPHGLYSCTEKYDLDQYKIKIAEQNGFKVFTVFSDELNNAVQDITNRIKEIYESSRI